MKVLIHNDGKETLMSYEATLDTNSTLAITVYGNTEEEAVETLKQEVRKVIERLQNVDYANIVQVDCMGREIKPRG